jgi:hypothetical protein
MKLVHLKHYSNSRSLQYNMYHMLFQNMCLWLATYKKSTEQVLGQQLIKNQRMAICHSKEGCLLWTTGYQDNPTRRTDFVQRYFLWFQNISTVPMYIPNNQLTPVKSIKCMQYSYPIIDALKNKINKLSSTKQLLSEAFSSSKKAVWLRVQMAHHTPHGTLLC